MKKNEFKTIFTSLPVFILILIVINLNLTSAAKPLHLNDGEKERIKKQKIERQDENTFFINKKDDHGVMTSQKFYDTSGNILKQTWFKSNGTVLLDQQFLYDSEGRCVEEKRKIKNDSLVRYVFRYNNKNQRNESDVINGNGSVEKHYYSFNDKNKIIEDDVMKPDGSREKFIYKYDAQGNEVETLDENNKGIQSKSDYIFDRYNNCIEDLWYNSKNELGYKIIRQFDSRGNKTEESRFQEGKLKIKKIFIYDNNNFLSGETNVDSEGKIIFELKFTNDKKGNRTEEKRINDKGEITLHNLEHYDENGNLIDIVWLAKDNFPEKIQKYSYSYFK